MLMEDLKTTEAMREGSREKESSVFCQEGFKITEKAFPSHV